VSLIKILKIWNWFSQGILFATPMNLMTYESNNDLKNVWEIKSWNLLVALFARAEKTQSERRSR